MYSVSKSPASARTAAVEIRALVGTKVPLVTAKALTFIAQGAQREIVRTMPQVFEGGATAYTLNATRIEPASVQRLVARVAVKDRSSNNGTLPEDYLLPQVDGGRRKEKRFERNLRYAGVLGPGQRAVLGRSVPANLLTAQGNLKRGEIQRILTATRTTFDPAQRKSSSARSRKNARNAPYFVGGLDQVSIVGGELAVTKGAMAPGIYRRQPDGGILPILVFVRKAPSYRPRLPFEDIARRVAEREFPSTFTRLLAAAARR
jgi:hypothetical protein